MSTDNTETQESTADDQPRVQVHTGLRMEPAELDDLDVDVREVVDEHIEFSDAYELEVRDWGDGVVNVIHRFAPAEEVQHGE